jgi:hypothetical protein
MSLFAIVASKPDIDGGVGRRRSMNDPPIGKRPEPEFGLAIGLVIGQGLPHILGIGKPARAINVPLPAVVPSKFH